MSSEHNFYVKNLGNTTSLRAAINAMCAHCMGCTADHMEAGYKGLIRSCSSSTCPLWRFRPCQNEQEGSNIEPEPEIVLGDDALHRAAGMSASQAQIEAAR